MSIRVLLTCVLGLQLSIHSYAGIAAAEDTTPPAAADQKAEPKEPSWPIPRKVLGPDAKVDTSAWPKDVAVGGDVQRISEPRGGLPRTQFPRVHFVSASDLEHMHVQKAKSGLYLLDLKTVPQGILDTLKSAGFTLQKDGTLLDKEKQPVVAVATGQLYQIKPSTAGEKTSRLDLGTGIAKRLAALLSPSPADAASPFPFRCYSFYPWAVYHGGFHRWFEASTSAAAYGADGSGGCSWGSPYTHIDYIQTRAAVSGYGDEHHCYSCDHESSYDTWDVGYFWPAFGGWPTTYHLGVWADGDYTFSNATNMTWR